MDSHEMMNLVGSEAEGNPAIEHSQKETMTPESRHSQQKSDASIAKTSSPCKETESTDRISSSPPTKVPKGTEESTTTINESRATLSLGSVTGTDEETPTTNKSSYGISSSTGLTKGTDIESATTNESRATLSLASTPWTDEETPTTNESSNGISSSTESTKGHKEETATTNESRATLSLGSATGTDEETPTTNKSRATLSLASATGTDEETPTTNESSNWISSSTESTKGPEEETATTNESRISSSPEIQKGTEGKTATTNVSSRWSPDDLEVFKHPLCLISTEVVQNEDGKKMILKSEQKVFEQIKQIDLPLVVVAAVGLYRTGKSFLMNCLANSSKGGFELGKTVQSKTQGIWVWCKMHPTQNNTVLMLLDTEGLGSVKKGDQNHDNHIFTLTTLLCNCLVYNMKGVFDYDAVSKLTFVTEMANNIRYRGQSSENNTTLKLILPDFVLCLRDLTLDLQCDDQSISANEYLDECLAEDTDNDEKFNNPRECIKKFFPKRNCFVFPLPGDNSVVRNLDNLNFDDLCHSFKEATFTFKSYIYDVPPKEMLGSKPINGGIFVTLANKYVTAIKHGAVPDVDDAFTAAAKIENARIENQALEIFKNQMVKVTLPEPGKNLRRLYTSAQQAALGYLRQNAVHDLKVDCEKEAQRKMDELWNTIKQDNDTSVKQMFEKKLQDNSLKRYIEKKVRNGDYEIAGGYQSFQLDVQQLRNEYFSVGHDFEEHEVIWTWIMFIESKKETDARILNADKTLTKKEKEDEQRRYQEYTGKLQMEHKKAQKEALDKQKKDLHDHYQKLLYDRDEQLKIGQAKLEAFLKVKLEKEELKKELERLKKEGREKRNKWFVARILDAIINKD